MKLSIALIFLLMTFIRCTYSKNYPILEPGTSSKIFRITKSEARVHLAKVNWVFEYDNNDQVRKITYEAGSRTYEILNTYIGGNITEQTITSRYYGGTILNIWIKNFTYNNKGELFEVIRGLEHNQIGLTNEWTYYADGNDRTVYLNGNYYIKQSVLNGNCTQGIYIDSTGYSAEYDTTTNLFEDTGLSFDLYSPTLIIPPSISIINKNNIESSSNTEDGAIYNYVYERNAQGRVTNISVVRPTYRFPIIDWLIEYY